MLVGWMFMLVGVIFFFVGGGWSIITAIISGRFSSAAFMPQLVFALAGVGIWLLGAILMLWGWIAATRKDRKQGLSVRRRVKKQVR